MKYKANVALISKNETFVKDNKTYPFKRLFIETPEGMVEIAPKCPEEEVHWKRILKKQLEAVAQPYQD